MPQTCSLPVVPGCLAWRQRGCVALLVGLVLSLHLASGGQAATTWTVCASGCDYASLKAAIAAPTTLDGDTLAIAAGTYTEAGITVNKSLTVQGEDADTTIVQAATTPGRATKRVVTIPTGVSVTLQALTIRYGRTADFGGGLYNAGTLTLSHSTVRDNVASYSGGGLANAGTLTLSHSTVRDNFAYWGGGVHNSGTMALTASTVSGNAAELDGGGLNNYGTLTLTASTVSGNAAGYRGGGFTSWSNSRLTLTASTVSGNAAALVDAAGQGGGLLTYGTLTLTGSLVAANPDGGDCRGEAPSGSSTSHGYNLDSDGSCQLTAPTDKPGQEPGLGPLQDNGGPTFTHALLPGSPAIDAIPWGANGCGTVVFSDQRGRARPQPAGGACDIGAYEVTVAGQALGAWVSGFTPHTVTCTNVTTGQVVTLSDPASPWDCEAEGLEVSSGDQVALRVRGPVKKRAADVGGAVVGMAPTSGGCTNRTTGQQVKFRALFQGQRGATAASCVAAGLVVQPGETVQMWVKGVAE